MAVHEEQVAEPGTRNLGLLKSALARPRNLAPNGAPNGAPDVAALDAASAAAYSCGIACNRPFVDGNKRTAHVAVELFLALNGLASVADDRACVMTMLAVASGTLDEARFATCLREHSAHRG